jgi:putative SOS response-associated peptidase YedK
MCGRYALTLTPEALRELYGYADRPNFPARYNIAPTQPVPVIFPEAGTLRFRLMRWGFLPAWVKDPKDFPLVINVRSETAAEKSAFRNAFKRRRAIMPADGFYEWRKVGKERQAFLIRRRDRQAFSFAALWETYASKDGSEIDTVAIMTTDANATLAPIHHRSPLILSEADHTRWLDPESTADDIQKLLQPPPDDLLETIAIGPAINKVANDDASVQRPMTGESEAPTIKKGGKRGGDESGQGSLF